MKRKCFKRNLKLCLHLIVKVGKSTPPKQLGDLVVAVDIQLVFNLTGLPFCCIVSGDAQK